MRETEVCWVYQSTMRAGTAETKRQNRMPKMPNNMFKSMSNPVPRRIISQYLE